jgi:hypothetical protein
LAVGHEENIWSYEGGRNNVCRNLYVEKPHDFLLLKNMFRPIK